MGLVSLFDFFDASGASTAQDSAGTAQDATFHGDAGTDGAGTASFDGDGDYAIVDPDPALNLSQGTVELSFVQDTASIGNVPYGGSPAQTLFSSDAYGNTEGHLTIYIKNDGTLMVRHQTDGQHHFYEGDKVTLGDPVEISYSFGPSGSELVMNGTTFDTSTVAHTLAGGTNPVVIGASTVQSSMGQTNNLKGFFDGEISRVAIYDDQTGSRGAAPACLVAGTLVLTPGGPAPVETLRKGDEVVTYGSGPVPLQAVLSRTIGTACLMGAPNHRPIRIDAGTLGNMRPLTVSRQHCLLMGLSGRDVLVRAGHLADEGMAGIWRMDAVDRVEYRHLLFEDHQMVMADGMWVESLLPGSGADPSTADAPDRTPPPTCCPVLRRHEVVQALHAGTLGPWMPGRAIGSERPTLRPPSASATRRSWTAPATNASSSWISAPR
ncbi:MAG: Hint domain-containing protein [Pseudomonadota bacterium]